jgi:hypothetical protein
MADVSVFDGNKWVSIAGESLTLTDTQTGETLAPVDATTHATAEVKLTLNPTESTASGTNAYDGLWKIPAGLKGAKGEKGDAGTSLELKGTVDYATPQTPTGTSTNSSGTVTVLQEPASYMGTAGNSLGDLYIVRFQGDAAAGGQVADGNGYVMALSGTSTPQAPDYEWNFVGPIRGPKGDGWKSDGTGYDDTTGIVTFASDDGLEFSTTDIRGSDGSDGSISLESVVTVDFKTDCSDGGSGAFAEKGDQSSGANYELTLTMPRQQHVYKGSATGTGNDIKPDDQTGDYATACAGDIWILS